ncbi:MAG: hypothetical protein V4685_07735 [Bacteroidota bacterium]
MKKIFPFFVVALFVVYSCKKIDNGSDAVKGAVLTMSSPSLVSVEGPIISSTSSLDLSGGEYIYGFCYSLTRNPVIPGVNTKAINYSAGSFSARLVNIEFGKKYFVRAFVTNGLVTTYSNADSFLVPTYIYTDTVKNISARSFDIRIFTLPAFADSITERGVCYDTIPNPVISSLKTVSTIIDTGFIALHVSDTLFPGKTYSLRSYFIANGRAVYGNKVSFRTAGYKGAYGYIIFDKVDTTNGWRYVEAALDTITVASTTWGCAGTNVPSALTSIGGGYENSIAITTACTDTLAAAYIATHKTLKGKTDWYLPSVDELKALYELKLSSVITRTAFLYSSTQASVNDCYILDLTDGSQQQIAKNSGAAFIWPMRRYK